MITFKRVKAENITPELACLFKHCAKQTINVGNTRIIEIMSQVPLIYIIENTTQVLDEEFDAVLDAWYISNTSKGYRLKGQVYNDKKMRFHDGQYVQTSPFVQTKATYKKGDIIQTRNSSYKLGRPFAG